MTDAALVTQIWERFEIAISRNSRNGLVRAAGIITPGGHIKGTSAQAVSRKFNAASMQDVAGRSIVIGLGPYTHRVRHVYVPLSESFLYRKCIILSITDK